MAWNLRCVVCNEEVDVLSGGGFGLWLFFPASPEGHQQPPGYLVHAACGERVAHPDFDVGTTVTGRPANGGEAAD
jgi:hypothetical protein